jgi:hypothetical protein
MQHMTLSNEDKAHSGKVSNKPAMVKKGANYSKRALTLRKADTTVGGMKWKKECCCAAAEINRY